MKYWEIGEELMRHLVTIRTNGLNLDEKMDAVTSIRAQLELCLEDPNLNDLTRCYRDCRMDNVLGFDPVAVQSFVGSMIAQYPGPYWRRSNESTIRVLIETNGSRKVYNGQITEERTASIPSELGVLAVAVPANGYIHLMSGMIGRQEKIVRSEKEAMPE